MTDETLSRQSVTCTEHGKILPHFGCAEAETWLDDLERRLECQDCYDVAHDEMDEREECDAHREDRE